MWLTVSEDVGQALTRGTPVVALETALLTHGLPRHLALEVADRLAHAVCAGGAVPAFCGVYEGRLWVGLDHGRLGRLLDLKAGKAAPRDLPGLVGNGGSAGTTVAGTLFIAAAAGIRVLATGGLGGIHRGPIDVSADLLELTRRQVAVVCSGAKAVLDVRATWEALEALGVPVVGLGCRQFPAFYCARSGIELEHTTTTVEEVAQWVARAWCLLGPVAVVVTVPPPAGAELAPEAIEAALADVTVPGGKAATPTLLEKLHHLTGGLTTTSNTALLLNNARLAAGLARSLTTVATAADGTPVEV